MQEKKRIEMAASLASGARRDTSGGRGGIDQRRPKFSNIPMGMEGS